jgi:hypothetical protein
LLSLAKFRLVLFLSSQDADVKKMKRSQVIDQRQRYRSAFDGIEEQMWGAFFLFGAPMTMWFTMRLSQPDVQEPAGFLTGMLQQSEHQRIGKN